jgi:hypothetical protein
MSCDEGRIAPPKRPGTDRDLIHHVGAIHDLSGARTICLEETHEPATSVGADLTAILRVAIGDGAQPIGEAERIVGVFLPPVGQAHIRLPDLAATRRQRSADMYA